MPQRRSEHKKRITEKRVHHSQDKKMLAVTAYLISIHPQGGTKNHISKKSKLRSQEGDEFKMLMTQLVLMGWVRMEKPKNIGGYDTFFVTDSGRDAVNQAKQISRENSPLGKLSIFDDICDF